mmetsp:Transcript_27920/g.32282  ORF Transcript_27920/g.32282 Transcript_27920/m.32282 type:complete len:391 (+) Transcript_27920:33-1205(+)
MCFYRDTQAALAQNNLRNLIKQRTHVASKPVKTQDMETIEVKTASEPYKRLHLSKSLYQDLLILSSNDHAKFEETSTTENSPMEEESVSESQSLLEEIPVVDSQTNFMGAATQQTVAPREDAQPAFLLDIFKNFSMEGKYINSADYNFFENILTSVERNNKLLSEFRTTQEKVGVNIGGYLKNASSSISREQYESPFERLEKASQNEKHRQRYNSNPSYFELLSHFTNGRTEFPYELVLNAEIPAPVFRERNIRIEVKLVRKSDNSIVLNHGNMLLQMSLHTWELPPNVIVRNKAGNKVLQGEDECELKNGEAVFDKIQINEVTSKFINGSIALVVIPKRPVNFGTSLESLHLKNTVRIEDIKPLLVSKLIVKSKKKNTAGKKNSPMDDN